MHCSSANVFDDTVDVTSYTAPIIARLDSINILTAQCWFKHEGSGMQTIFEFVNVSGGFTPLSLQFNDSVLIGQVSKFTTGSGTTTTYTVYTVPDTGWHHIALVINNPIIYMYLDRVMVDSSTCSLMPYNVADGAPQLFEIGTHYGDNKFNGNVYNLRIDANVNMSYDTCGIDTTSAFISAPMNSIDSIHIHVYDTAIVHAFKMSETSLCGDTTTTTMANNVSPANEEITIAPNPTQTSIIISSSIPVLNVCIRNMLGQIVYAKNFNDKSINIDVHDMSSGMYFLKINNGNIYRIVKQ